MKHLALRKNKFNRLFYILIIFQIFFTTNIFAQANWKELDSLTYQSYINEDWKNIVQLSKNIHKKTHTNIDK